MTDQTVTDEEVQESRGEVDALRSELADAKREAAATAAGEVNSIRKEALDTEAESLRQQIAAVRGVEAPVTNSTEYEVPMGTVDPEAATALAKAAAAKTTTTASPSPRPPSTPTAPTPTGPKADDKNQE